MQRSNSESASPTVGGRTPEMTLYDQHRKPHRLITDNTEIVISPRSLDSELMCPICLDMLKDTMTTKECLHRFCQECITTALRNGNKECPTCRKKLVSKRSLRADPNFDSLIAKIYPNREEYEAMQQRALAKLAAHSSSKSFQDCMEEGIKYQAQLRKRNKIDSKDFEYAKRVRRPRASAPDAAPDEEGLADAPETRESSLEPSASEASGAAGVEAGAVGGGGGGGNEVELILRPHSDLSGDDECPAPLKTTRFLKTTDNATVEHIANYVAIRVKLDTEESARLAESTGSALVTAPQWAADTFRVFINPGIGSNKPFTLLDHNLTLAEVRSRYWKVKRPLELQFKLGDESPTAAPPASALPPPPSSLSLSTAHPNGNVHNPPLSSPLQNSLFGSSGNS